MSANPTVTEMEMILDGLNCLASRRLLIRREYKFFVSFKPVIRCGCEEKNIDCRDLLWPDSLCFKFCIVQNISRPKYKLHQNTYEHKVRSSQQKKRFIIHKL